MAPVAAAPSPSGPLAPLEERGGRGRVAPGAAGRAIRLALVFGALGLAVFTKTPLCPVAIVTRHPCPGCGLTRATLEILHGHFGAAFALHPLVFIASPLVAAMLVYNSISYLRTGLWSASEGVQGRWVTRGALVLFVAFNAVWIARFCGAFGGPVPVN